MLKPYWTNRLARIDETASVLRLVRAVHGDKHLKIDETLWQWRYLNNQGYHADILMAEQEGQPIGIQPVAMFDWQWGQQHFRGAVYTGVLTHPDHRRRGVFRSLIGSSNEHSTRCGALFSMTMPNDASLPGFLKFHDWTYPGPIPLWFKVIGGRNLLTPKIGGALGTLFGWLPEAVFRRRGHGLGFSAATCEAVAIVPDELDEVFDSFARDCGALMLRRTAAYWNWRYGAKSASGYRTLLLRQGGRLLGAVVTSVGRRMGLDIGMILDLVGRGGVPVLRELVREAETELRNRGLGLVTCQSTSRLLDSALAQEGYWRPDPAWLPKRFHFVYRPTGLASLPRPPCRLSDWHLTFGDSDNA